MTSKPKMVLLLAIMAAVATPGIGTAQLQRRSPAPVALVTSYRAAYLYGGSCLDIQHAIDSLPATGFSEVVIEGRYDCSAPIVINRDNVSLSGRPGTVIRLRDDANSPVLVIGDLSTPPARMRRHIRISDLVIDGNRTAQRMECWSGPCGSGGVANIRNNGISVRGAEDVQIDNVTIHSAASGGLVIEQGCRLITVRDLTSFDNQFDGLAAYEVEDSVFSNLNLYRNLAAGLSFDLNFNNNTIRDSTITDSGSVGIFMRYSNGNLFEGIKIRNSGQYGVFLAQVDGDETKPASGNTFLGLRISESMLAAFRVNDESCVDNLVCSCQFVNNKGGTISEARAGLIQVCGNISR
jgi:hypothetical protein